MEKMIHLFTFSVNVFTDISHFLFVCVFQRKTPTAKLVLPVKRDVTDFTADRKVVTATRKPAVGTGL